MFSDATVIIIRIADDFKTQIKENTLKAVYSSALM